MNTQFYFLHEVRNVLFAHLVSPRLAAATFARPGGIALASPEELRELADRRKKLLHITGLPLEERQRRVQQAEPVPV